MTMVVNALVLGLWLTTSQGTPTAAQETWLKTFEGAWVLDGAVGPDVDVVVNVSREKKVLVLSVVIRDREIVTRYDLSGVDITNQSLGRKSTFRTRIDGEKLVTAIWSSSEVAGAPARIETRYMKSPDLMVTELARSPGGQPFHRGVLRRKGR